MLAHDHSPGSFKNATQSYAGHHLLLKKTKCRKWPKAFSILKFLSIISGHGSDMNF
jgi:hypothetical protein